MAAASVPHLIHRVLAARTHYEVLDCDVQATIADIKSSFRALSLSLHPDKCSEPDAAQAFSKLSEAHAVLSDVLRRRSYDHTLRMEGRFH